MGFLLGFYLGGAFYVAALAATDKEIAGDYMTVILSSLSWPYGIYQAIKSGGGIGRE